MSVSTKDRSSKAKAELGNIFRAEVQFCNYAVLDVILFDPRVYLAKLYFLPSY